MDGGKGTTARTPGGEVGNSAYGEQEVKRTNEQARTPTHPTAGVKQHDRRIATPATPWREALGLGWPGEGQRLHDVRQDCMDDVANMCVMYVCVVNS